MAFNLAGLLQQYLTGGAGQASDSAVDHFHQVAQQASPDILSQGLAAAFHSDQTPPFGQMVAQLFAQGNSQQQAGMLTQLLGSLSPAALAALTSSGALAGLLTKGGLPPSGAVTAEQVSQVTPEQVQAIASHAETHSPGIIDKMSTFYSQHPGLMQTLGGAALSIALAKIAQGMRS
jgi:hypothetical protein